MQSGEFQKIKQLRERLSISVTEAKALIEDNNGNILAAEKEFHKHNINTICRLAECDDTEAKKYYELYKFDIEKAVKKITGKLTFLTTTSSQSLEKIGFVLWAENDKLDAYETLYDKSIFIPSKDFDYVIAIFKSVYPLYYEDTDETANSFDIKGKNFFDNKTCRILIEKMSKIKTSDHNVELFLRELIKWFNSKIRYAEYIVVYGNL